MTTYINEKEAQAWRDIASKFREASRLMEEARLILIQELGLFSGRPWEAMDKAEDALRGQAYMFSPQGEWMGGDIEHHAYKTRAPHIAGGAVAPSPAKAEKRPRAAPKPRRKKPGASQEVAALLPLGDRFDTRSETPIPLSAVPALLPMSKAGTPTHKATIWRWAMRGLHGVRLETLQVGGRRCTSQAALQRFFEKLTQASNAETKETA